MAAVPKFPDEMGIDGPKKKEELHDELKIELVDDTPLEDRDRKPMPKEVVDDLEKDDDLDEYSERVQTRLKALKKVYHDERREKERASREREEAVRFAQVQLDENKALKQRLSSGEKIFVSEVTGAAKTQLEAARAALKQANASGDADLISAAQEALYDAKAKVQRAESFVPADTGQDNKTNVNNTQQSQYQPSVDTKAAAWRDKNSWFGVDEEMTALSLALHEKLVKAGVDPRSDEYYQRIDSNIKKRFPERFEDDDKTESGDKTPRKPATVVASVSRSTSPKQVRLNTSEVAIAKKLGITVEAYAREKLKSERTDNG